MTLHQKLQNDLEIEKMALDRAIRDWEDAKAKVTEHEIRIAYIRECLSLDKGGAKATSHPEPTNGHTIDIDQAIRQAFHHAQGKMRIPAIVARVIELGYGKSDEVEKVRKNVSSFLLRKAKDTETSGYKKVGRGLFEYAETHKERKGGD